jgi:hypothetical protein
MLSTISSLGGREIAKIERGGFTLLTFEGVGFER